MRRGEMSLARQYLALQLLIVLAVLVIVPVISLAQSESEIRRVEGRRALSAAENLAANATVRSRLPEALAGRDRALAAVGETTRTVSGASDVLLAGRDRTVVTSSDPTQVGTKLAVGESRVLQGAAWTGVTDLGGVPSVVAHVPVQNLENGEIVGFTVIGRDYPSVLERISRSVPNMLTYLAVGSALGVAGSLLLARRVKRQTLGLEPSEIAGLVEHREAMLHGLKEGVIAVDPAERITLANDSARTLLGLPGDCVGRTLEELAVDPQLRQVLTEGSVPDRLVLVDDRVLAFNRRPMRSRGRVIGSVTTLRDRTELSALEQQLGTTRATSDTLRAQTHEFANQLHTISGLLHLQEYDEVVRFVDGVSLSRTTLYDEVTSRIDDPTLAALLIAKASLATERGVALELLPDSHLDRMDQALSRDLTTVVGNLVDNALDAVAGQDGARVLVLLDEDTDAVRVMVRDSGPGVPDGDVEAVFRQGWTTKGATAQGGRGFGLALTRLVCRRRGGDVSMHNDDGAVFTAVLPRRAAGR
ncbi:MAG TPA: sensor histidine kinase [Nocardioidaceae bacterium]|nr:sensor histidine kinase [Nocardioidaceae bacterium]